MGKTRYVVEKVEIDGLPKGDVIKQYNGKKLVAQKFVPAKQLQKIAAKAKKVQEEDTKSAAPSPKKKIVYSRTPANNEVVVKNKTNFAEYIKLGAGVGIGMLAVEAVFDGVAALF
jgi:DNA-binding beta-propeller fold protein YncE